jgi:hypothetical protein
MVWPILISVAVTPRMSAADEEPDSSATSATALTRRQAADIIGLGHDGVFAALSHGGFHLV